AVTPRTAVIRQGERQVRGLEESHDIVRWASAAKKGAISEIFKVGGDYVVAMLTAIDDNEYTPVEVAKDQIANIIRRDKKYDYIVSNFKGTTLEEYAQSYGVDVKEFSDLSYSSFFVQNLGFEPRVIGAISVAEQGVLSAPVKGNAGVVVFLVEDIATEETQTAESEQVRAQATAEDAALQLSFRAVQQMAEMEDLRGEYF
ncbi:MAG: peptidylprolyl isomerase, partial [Alistipes sp.]|nr:peptidylprolyl isomerase [Alistipes sp.]